MPEAGTAGDEDENKILMSIGYRIFRDGHVNCCVFS
jgi:hypothetical protein